jgi:hypothetical protein
MHAVIIPSDVPFRQSYDMSDRNAWPELKGDEPRHPRSCLIFDADLLKLGPFRLWRTRRYTP